MQNGTFLLSAVLKRQQQQVKNEQQRKRIVLVLQLLLVLPLLQFPPHFQALYTGSVVISVRKKLPYPACLYWSLTNKPPTMMLSASDP